MKSQLRCEAENPKEGRHILAHMVKRKRIDKTFLNRCMQDFRNCKKYIINLDLKEKIKEMISDVLLEILDEEKRTKDF